jgi:hypothetical protein
MHKRSVDVRSTDSEEPHVSTSNPFGEPIHVYSRQQAFADGVLVEVPLALAQEAGFRWPVAMTAAAWADAVAWDDATDRAKGGFTGQSETGRLWDVLFMARMAIASANPSDRRITYRLGRVPADGPEQDAQEISLALVLGPGDHGEPVLTIMQPNED